MCRYEKESDIGYQRTSGYIISLVKKTIPKAKPKLGEFSPYFNSALRFPDDDIHLITYFASFRLTCLFAQTFNYSTPPSPLTAKYFINFSLPLSQENLYLVMTLTLCKPAFLASSWNGETTLKGHGTSGYVTTSRTGILLISGITAARRHSIMH